MMDGGLVRLVACVVGTLAVVGLRASMRKSPKKIVLDLAEGRPMALEGEETTYCADPMAGPVLRGVDVVAYRSLRPLEKAVMGEARFQARHGSYNFYFRSSSNRNLFVDDPVRYAPKFGGFCSYGICDESMWTSSTLGPLANPNVWAIIDDRLYVYMYCTPEHKFLSGNVSAQIAEGDARWHNWFHDEPVYNTQCFWDSKNTGGHEDQDKQEYDCLKYPPPREGTSPSAIND